VCNLAASVDEDSHMTMRRVLFTGVVAWCSFLAQPNIMAECLTLRADEHGTLRVVEDTRFDAPAPIAVSGALCGTARIDRAEARLVSGLPLNLFDEHDVLVATTVVDATGSFKFSPVASGRYRLEPPVGFFPSKQAIEVTAVANNTCDHPLYVSVSFPSECAPLTRVTTTRPPGF